jgi:hypothetical protein
MREEQKWQEEACLLHKIFIQIHKCLSEEEQVQVVIISIVSFSPGKLKLREMEVAVMMNTKLMY